MKLPGPSPSQPNRYSFGTPYRDIYEDLQQKDAKLYAANGLLEMIKRDVGVKLAPQRWQDRPKDAPQLDVVVTFERKVMVRIETKENMAATPTFYFVIHILYNV